MWILLGVTLASAGEPAAAYLTDLRPVLAPADAPAQFAAYTAKSGKPAALACEPQWGDQQLLCYRYWEGTHRRWATQGDLVAWGVPDASALRAPVAAIAAHEVDARAELVPIAQMTATYLRIADGDWASAGVVAPEAVAARLGGGPVLIAMPTDAVLFAWKQGDPEVDRVMAIAVRELYDAEDGLTPMVWRWDGKWSLYAVANPKTGDK